ncbi:MAG: hypothetical protein AAF657_04815 [Acidobacteriota bacterium]
MDVTISTERPETESLPSHQLKLPHPGWELVAFLAAVGVVIGLFWWRLLWMPHMVERVEVQVLSLTLWWQSGLFPYVHPDALPVLQNPYGPFYPWLCFQLPATATHPYLAGRALSLVAILSTLGLVFYWVRRRTGNGWLASLCALLPLATKPLILFAPLHRVDSLGLLLSVGGFVAVTTYPSRCGILLGGAAFLLAFLTKMTFIAAPLAVALFFWLSGRRGVAVGSAALTAITLPAAVAICEHLSDGAYLAGAAFGNLPTAWSKSFDMLLRTGLTGFWLAALATAAAACRFDPRRSPACIYAATSLAIAAAFAANPLSSWNYLMEPYIALGLLTGEILQTHSLRRRRARSVLVLLVLHISVTLPMATLWIQRATEPLPEYRQRYATALQRLPPLLDAAPGASASPLVILGSLAGYDALNALGAPNPVSVPPSLENTQWVSQAVEQAENAGTVDVLRGEAWLGSASAELTASRGDLPAE